MKCLILAAGYATRLYPLTKNFPKPLLEVKGKTILDWLISDIDRSGVVDEYIVVTNHKFASIFEEWASKEPYRITIVDDGTSSNEARLGAVRDIEYALNQLDVHDDVLVIAGDNLLDFSLSSFLSYSLDKGSSCLMRYYEPSIDRLRKSGVLTLEGDRVISMSEKPSDPASHWLCPPFYYYRQEDIARIGEAIASGCGVDAPGSLVAWLCKIVPVYAFEMPGNRYDIGTLEGYEKIKKEYRGLSGEDGL